MVASVVVRCTPPHAAAPHIHPHAAAISAAALASFAACRLRRRSLHIATSVVRYTSSTVTSHTGQPEKHAIDRHLRPPMRRCLAVVDDDGEGAMGDDDGDGATGDDDDGDGATGDDVAGYDGDNDCNWRQ